MEKIAAPVQADRRRSGSTPLIWALNEDSVKHVQNFRYLWQHLGSQLSLRNDVPFERESGDEASDESGDDGVALMRQTFVDAWLSAQTERVGDELLALECLCWIDLLPTMEDEFAPATREAIWSALTAIVGRGPESEAAVVSLDRQLLHGELPLALAAARPDAPERTAWIALAADCIATGLAEAADPEGLPRAIYLPVIRPLVASWTRCLQLAAKAELPWHNDTLRVHYGQLITHLMRLTRWDGRPIFAEPTDQAEPDFLRAAIALAGDEAQRIANVALAANTKRSASRGKAVKKKKSTDDTPLPSEYSESARLAILRSDWASDSLQMAITYSGRHVACELNCRREVVWSGPWLATVQINGQVREPQGDWEEVCWFSDEEVDYLELSQAYEDGWKLHRQFLLIRDCHSVYLADTVSGDQPAEIAYTGRLPLGDSLQLLPAQESHEATLMGVKRQGLVLPLFLPEWRAEPTRGGVSFEGSDMAWHASVHGHALHTPMWITLDATLMRRPYTWRRLTVAENLQAVPRDVADAYRIQFGADQWLTYRVLTRRGNRSVLGLNTSSDFVAARFSKSGTTDTLVDIE